MDLRPENSLRAKRCADQGPVARHGACIVLHRQPDIHAGMDALAIAA